ncbi:hypothetical protein M758_1G113900 [Ceratodon purpureus]|nr:hypothetical protein M758_1G113900 [Ceratodon purpureus]
MASTGAAINGVMILVGVLILFCSLHIDAKETRFNDVDNCGKCKHKCPRAPPHSERTCKQGKCGSKCKRGWKDCDHNKANGCEVDVKTDVNNCGLCGNVCPVPLTNQYGTGAATCTNGVCGSTLTCTAGNADCDGDPSNGCEIDLVGINAGNENCGSCGFVCPRPPANATAFASCDLGGVCIFLCKFFGDFLGFEDCDKDPSNFCETNTNIDVNNCGGCGSTCIVAPNGQFGCTHGICAGNCKKGEREDCDKVPSNACEQDLLFDANNCGSCGFVCPTPPNATPICQYKTCTFTCKKGFSDCDKVASNGCEVHGTCPNA